MAWFIFAIVVVSLVFLFGFRKIALGALVVVALGGIALYLYNEEREEQATTRIPESQIVLENVAVRQTFGASYDLSGRVTNNSETDRLDGLGFNVKLRDCQGDDKSNCAVIGEAAAYISMTVPPQEARDFTGSVYFGSNHKKAKGTLAWEYEVTAITAKRQ